MRESNRLTVKSIEAERKNAIRTKKAVTLLDGIGGVRLKIGPTGRGRWSVRVKSRTPGKRHDIGLGSDETIDLKTARDMAHEARKAAQRGSDPVAKRRAERQSIVNFETIAETVHTDRMKARGNAKHQQQWITTLRTYAFPVIGKMPVGEVKSGDVLRIVKPIWQTKHETASRVLQRIGTVLDAAVASGHRSEDLANAAHAARAGGLQKHHRMVRHHPAVPWQNVPTFVVEVRTSQSSLPVRLALEFLLLTAARTNEVLGMRWSEIDFEAKLWTVPDERMKKHREHRVPLAERTLEILRECKARWPRSELVFPGRRWRRPLSNMAMAMLMKRIPRDEVPHGLRSSFRDWAADNRWDRDLAEAALAHVLPDKTESAYRRSDLLEARRPMMTAWAAFVCGQPAQDAASKAEKVPEVAAAS